MSAEDFRVCMFCKFYDSFDSTCKRYPPVFVGYRQNKDGDNVSTWRQPDIELDWAENCGEWQPSKPEQSVKERRALLNKHVSAWAETNPTEAAAIREHINTEK